MTICYIALGSNLKSPERQLRNAIKALAHLPRTNLLAVAPFYRNKAIGRRSQPNFYNTVVKLSTTLPPQHLLTLCLQQEKRQGRVRTVKWGARSLDLDILLYGNQCIKTHTLTIPHPRILERDFVFIPLLQINQEIKMPDKRILKNTCILKDREEFCLKD